MEQPGEEGWVVTVEKKVDYKIWNKIQIPGKFNLKYARKTKEMTGDLQIKSLKRHVKQQQCMKLIWILIRNKQL